MKKLKNPSELLDFYPIVNSSWMLRGEPSQFKPENSLLDVVFIKNGIALIRIPAMGFAYIWENELTDF